MYQDHHIDEKLERLRQKLRDELGPVIVGLLDRSSGIEDIVVNEDSRVWVKRTGCAFQQMGELSSRQIRGAMMTIASMQRTTVTELQPVLETQLPIWNYRFAGLIEPVVPSPSFAIRVKPDRKRNLRDLQQQGVFTRRDDPRLEAWITLESFKRQLENTRTSWWSAEPGPGRPRLQTRSSRKSIR